MLSNPGRNKLPVPEAEVLEVTCSLQGGISTKYVLIQHTVNQTMQVL